LGLAQNAVAKFIPQSYLYSDVKSRTALLQGLCDTDGTITKAGRVSFTTISPQLRDDIVLLVETLGGNAY
jgi:intein/homing endonuclease